MVLTPVLHDEASVNPSSSSNCIYCGDNLTVLQYLLEGQKNLIDMIYIDPPYNTGKDFTFRDSFKHDRYRSLPSLKDTSNMDPHSLWRQFMEPRRER